MSEVNNSKTSKRKKPLVIHWESLLPTDDSVSHRPPDHAVPSARKSKGRGEFVQSFEMKTDAELEEMIMRIEKNVLSIGHRLPDKGEKIKETLRRYVDELHRRKRNRVDTDEREEDANFERMRRRREEIEAEKKQGNEVKGKLIDAEKKIAELEGYVVDLQEKLRDSSAQLDVSEKEKKELANRLEVAERNCASVADDSKWLLREGLPFLVKKLVNELSKENFMTVSELRNLHQRSSSD